MKVIYYCYGGTHTSVVAAAIHVGILSSAKVPGYEEFLKLKYFDNLSVKDQGRLIFFGMDENCNQVYSCGMRNNPQIVKNAMKSALHIYNINYNELYFVNLLPYINTWVRLGGFLSRYLGIRSAGFPLIIKGSKKSFKIIADFVEEIKKELI